MVPPEPPIERLDLTAARRQWARLLARVRQRQARVLLEHDGVPRAALVHPDDLARLQHWEARRHQHFAAIETFGAPFQDEPPEESERLAAEAVAQARAERHRAERTTGRWR